MWVATAICPHVHSRHFPRGTQGQWMFIHLITHSSTSTFAEACCRLGQNASSGYAAWISLGMLLPQILSTWTIGFHTIPLYRVYLLYCGAARDSISFLWQVSAGIMARSHNWIHRCYPRDHTSSSKQKNTYIVWYQAIVAEWKTGPFVLWGNTDHIPKNSA